MVKYSDVKCGHCFKECFGDVVTARGQYYHQNCFSCAVGGCQQNLLKSGYFYSDGKFYCTTDYRKLRGTQCKGCRKYVEGDSISAINSLYHPECFACERCHIQFQANIEICFDGKDLFCRNCYSSPNDPKRLTNGNCNGFKHINKDNQCIKSVDKKVVEKNNHSVKPMNGDDNNINTSYSTSVIKPTICAGCNNAIKSDQSLLLALEKQWHLWCFNCFKCGMLLAGDYMVRDGMPYCEQDYQTEFGVSCASCGGYITGKVLQAGDKHYHPSCSHCAKCGLMFGEGEEMYLQGSEIWHPDCCEELGHQVEESDITRDSEFDITPIDYGDFSLSLNDSSDSFRHFVEREEARDKIDGKRKYNGPVYDILSSSKSHLNYTNGHKNGQHNGHHNSNGKASSTKVPGFRSVKPPSTYSTLPEKRSVQKETKDENTPPPVPAPPTRSSSKMFLQKYNSGVYGAAPYQNSTESVASNASSESPPHHHHSAVVYRRQQNGDDGRRISKSKPLSTSTPSLNQSNNDDESTSSNESPSHAKRYQKGCGYNKLQRRRSLREDKSNPIKLPTNIDPERLRRFLEDPDHNVYLDDREFYQIFKITREKYYALPQGKKDELKAEALKCFEVANS